MLLCQSQALPVRQTSSHAIAVAATRRPSVCVLQAATAVSRASAALLYLSSRLCGDVGAAAEQMAEPTGHRCTQVPLRPLDRPDVCAHRRPTAESADSLPRASEASTIDHGSRSIITGRGGSSCSKFPSDKYLLDQWRAWHTCSYVEGLDQVMPIVLSG